MKALLSTILFLPFRSAFVATNQPRHRESESSLPTFRQPTSGEKIGHMGVPEHLKHLAVGDTVVAVMGESKIIVVERLSSQAPIFIARNLVSPELCHHIQATVKHMEQGRTESGDNNRFRPASLVGWLSNQNDALVGNLAETVHSIFLPNQSYRLRFVEDMQVVQYQPGGEYLLHHDDKDRMLTVLYYLNGVGATWFPLCDYPTQCASRIDALKLANDMVPETEGVLVSSSTNARIQIGQGDAIAFYNYLEDGSTDWNMIHAGMPAIGEKWIANHWFHRVPYDGI